MSENRALHKFKMSLTRGTIYDALCSHTADPICAIHKFQITLYWDKLYGLYNTGCVRQTWIQQHKVFDGLAQRGKSSTGWFYGFKLHLVINDRGEILSFCLTPGNIDDRNKDVIGHLTKDLFGKLFADKGYISKKLSEELWEKGIELITKQKKNAKNPGVMRLCDRLLLRKRAVIESVNDFLKNICQIEPSRRRSSYNFVVNLVAGLAAYSFLPKSHLSALKKLLQHNIVIELTCYYSFKEAGRNF